MAKRGESLQVVIPERRRNTGGLIFGRNVETIPAKTIVVNEGQREGFNGFFWSGRRVSRPEVRRLAEIALKERLLATEVASEVERVSSKGKKRKLRKGLLSTGLSGRIEKQMKKQTKDKAKEAFDAAREQELANARLNHQHMVSPLQRMFASWFMTPITELEGAIAGLRADNVDQRVLTDMSDAVKSAALKGFPEEHADVVKQGRPILKRVKQARKYVKTASKWAKRLSKVADNEIVNKLTGIASIVPIIGGGVFGTALDAVQLGVDRGEGKRPKYLRASVKTMIADFFGIIPFFGEGNMRNAKIRMDNTVIRAYMNIATDAMSNPNSPYYQHREAIAKSLLDMVGGLSDPNAVTLGKVEPDSTTPLPGRTLGYYLFDHQYAPLSGFRGSISPREKEIRHRQAVRWQRDVANVVDQSRNVLGISLPQQPQQ